MKRQNQLNIKRGLLSKLVLLVALFLGSSNAWGEDYTIFGGSLQDGWKYTNGNNVNMSIISSVLSNYNEEYSDESKIRLYTSNESNISISSNQQIVINAKRYGTKDLGYIKVKYSSNDGTTWTVAKEFTSSDLATTYQDLDAVSITPGTYKIQIEFLYATISSIILKSNDPFPAPTNFHVIDLKSASVTFEWTKGKDENNWKLAYSTNPNFTPDVNSAISITENPYELTGLTEGTTYYACICADYGGRNYSDWTEKVAFTPSDEKVITINDVSTTTNSYVPVDGNSVKGNLTRSQFIIPSAKLSEINRRQITQLTFYSNTSSSNYQEWDLGSATFEIYLKEVSGTTYSSTTMADWGTKVYSGTLSVSDYEMTITLDTPYNYNGGNLQVGFKQTNKATEAKYFSWVGISSTNSARSSTDDNTATYRSFNPELTIKTVSVNTDPVQIDDNGYTTFASKWPLDLTALPTGLKAYKAVVSAGEGKVRFTLINQTVAANTGILLAGTAGETYNIPVADSGDPVGDNAFLVNSTGGTFAAENGYTYFGFKKNSDPITFATFNPSTVAIPTNKAYLKVLTKDLPTEARQLVAVFDDGETTSLREIRNEELGIKNAVFFNLNGQRVAQPTKGLYIVNGKKVLVP